MSIVVFLDYWGVAPFENFTLPTLGSEFWIGLIGVIIGALLSGGISFFLQLESFKREQKRLSKKNFEEKKVLALGVVFKLRRIHSDIYNVHRHFDYCVNKADPESLSDHWSYMMPWIRPWNKFSFSTGEVVLIFKKDNNRIVNDLLDIQYLHQNIGNDLIEYRKLHEKLEEAMPRSETKGTTSISELSEQERLKLFPSMVKANSLVVGLHENIEQHSKQTQNLLDETLNQLKKHYQLSFDIEYSDNEKESCGG